MPRVFAIADLHLSFARPKPMDVFGELWADHVRRLEAAWRREVAAQDIVLVAGDISWAMRLPEALADLQWLAALPGEKVLIRGNHDYWWESISKLRRLELPGVHFVQYDSVHIGPVAIGGTRLWELPELRWPQEWRPMPVEGGGKRQVVRDQEKLVARELNRLELSLGRLPRQARHRLAMVHYPPVGSDGEPSRASAIMTEHGIDCCVFGHLHALGPGHRLGADCVLDGTRYLLVSGDWVGFEPRVVLEF